jgi:nucleoside-diphosphate-sugar epimerase
MLPLEWKGRRDANIPCRTEFFSPEQLARSADGSCRCCSAQATPSGEQRARTTGRLVAQSIAWVYAPGREPHSEEDPLDRDAKGPAAISVSGVMALERLTLSSPPLEGVVLRYGQLYGPGTWNAAANGRAPVHVDAAAHAALLAVDAPHTGVFNIAEEKGLVSAGRARRLLGWSAEFRC